MNPDDLLLCRWQTFFHPDRTFVLRWLTPAQRAVLEQRMNDDCRAAIDELMGTDHGKPGSE